MKEDMASKAKESATVVVAVKSESTSKEDELMEMDDKKLDSLSESDAKSFLKALREEIKSDDG